VKPKKFCQAPRAHAMCRPGASNIEHSSFPITFPRHQSQLDHLPSCRSTRRVVIFVVLATPYVSCKRHRPWLHQLISLSFLLSYNNIQDNASSLTSHRSPFACWSSSHAWNAQVHSAFTSTPDHRIHLGFSVCSPRCSHWHLRNGRLHHAGFPSDRHLRTSQPVRLVAKLKPEPNAREVHPRAMGSLTVAFVRIY